MGSVSSQPAARASAGEAAGPVVQRQHCFRPAGVSCTPIPKFPEMAPGDKQGLLVLSSAAPGLWAQ